ncbi:ADP,ATP carrier protein 1, mitochondrial [Capsicum chinense]|nr:ADP,ATP carrier protein 1, mitochondrial [Capsicum chinense]
MIIANASPVFVQAPAEKGVAAFATDFLMGGVSAAVSKTAAAPIERMKLLIQRQDEMIKAGRLSEPYKGIGDCFKGTMQAEGAVALWRGNTANVILRRRMMMTSGEAVKHKSSLDAFSQILKNEGPKSLFKVAGANILRAVAGVLAGYDKLQMIVFGKKYGSGTA